MRTLDPILDAALTSGNYTPFFRWEHRINKGELPYISSDNILNFKLTGTEFNITLYDQVDPSSAATPENEFGRLIRGITVSGIEYSVETSDFYITEWKKDENFEFIKAQLFPNKSVSFQADGTYESVLTTYCALFGLTPSFKHPTDTWLGYQFLPTGKYLSLNNASALLPLLRQKYLIITTDNGNNEVQFSHAFSGISSPEYTIEDVRFKINLFNKRRRYVSRSESATLTYSGATDDPLHNLGYLHSTASHPAISTISGDQQSPIFPVHLKYQDGDYVEIKTDLMEVLLLEDGTFFFLEDGESMLITGSLGKVFKIAATEEFNSEKFKEISWRSTLESAEVFTNTAGGAMPSTIERIAAYTPLVTVNFDKNLDITTNNLQALAEAVDEMTALKIMTSAPTVAITGKTFALNTTTGKFYVWSGTAWTLIN